MVLTARVPGGPNLLWEAHLYQDELIQCQRGYGDYVCSCGRFAMSGGDGMDSSTRVPVVRLVMLDLSCNSLISY
jgi:hypothetical protein